MQRAAGSERPSVLRAAFGERDSSTRSVLSDDRQSYSNLLHNRQVSLGSRKHAFHIRGFGGNFPPLVPHESQSLFGQVSTASSRSGFVPSSGTSHPSSPERMPWI